MLATIEQYCRQCPVHIVAARKACCFERMQCVYEKLPGWKSTTLGITKYDELPAAAKDYLAFLETETGVEVGAISTGPERNQTIIIPGSRLEQLLA